MREDVIKTAKEIDATDPAELLDLAESLERAWEGEDVYLQFPVPESAIRPLIFLCAELAEANSESDEQVTLSEFIDLNPNFLL